MAKQLTHKGKTSGFFGGTYTTSCGISVPTSQTTNLWWSSKPTCPACKGKK